jgi:hypothetical protein
MKRVRAAQRTMQCTKLCTMVEWFQVLRANARGPEGAPA